ncbi:post-transcriptional regulator [Aneurinibacillus aneurinilyticus]|nr:post-transcriptional regulator [Aneurinibacillus aneurinilyticus]MCI1693910.1 post-transcriptional regulator [Aneurinibacillus aneurinilyticus]MED0672576.1 post-transcriptional regulator [Aneurinibacillus aneurinilyticus]MED0709410.1 post-transcriptional regulator [Aneurinibacillus aneurinilyticus]MED0724655.1 post-transcriptional regulator [Aneurinibacillus aneurinilyticus]MED0732044.1 post-transcriptional regulator [Aneurinibacillus aneurinilyticus]
MWKYPMDEQLAYVCEIKAQEFAMLGYDDVTVEEIWECISEKYKEMPSLHKVVNDILSLKPGRWMNWVTMRAFRGELM